MFQFIGINILGEALEEEKIHEAKRQLEIRAGEQEPSALVIELQLTSEKNDLGGQSSFTQSGCILIPGRGRPVGVLTCLGALA